MDITITVPITDEERQRIGVWFPRWNATLDTPYASFDDALTAILKHQIDTFIRVAGPEEVQDAYERADDRTKAAVKAALNLL